MSLAEQYEENDSGHPRLGAMLLDDGDSIKDWGKLSGSDTDDFPAFFDRRARADAFRCSGDESKDGSRRSGGRIPR